MSTYDEILDYFDEHMKSSGRYAYSSFYVGTTTDTDVKGRLFNVHGLRPGKSWWAYCCADSPETARRVKDHYLELGMRGTPSASNDPAQFVYCYVVTPTTIER